MIQIVEAIEVSALTKKIKNKTIIKDISFSVKQGEVFGFLGQNGSGKTTTIRMLVGMIKPTSGTILINGLDLKNHFSQIMHKVGGIVENPSFYAYLSGWENMKQRSRLLHAKVTDADLLEIVEVIGLSGRIHDRVENYSLGMKQRLGIGIALIGKPKLIFLDEPINGLDPQGIIEIRQLIKRMSKELNITIFISSHILSELEHIIDCGMIIHHGKKVADITAKDLQVTQGDQTYLLTYEKSDRVNLQVFMKETQIEIKEQTDTSLHFIASKQEAQHLLTAFIEEQIVITKFHKQKRSLEDLYLEATSEKVKGD